MARAVARTSVRSTSKVSKTPNTRVLRMIRVGRTRSSCSNPASRIRIWQAGQTIPPTTGSNSLRGQEAGSDPFTLGNAKGIYNDILSYFATRQDKLFVLITAPPQNQDDTDAAHAANARALANWLVNDWLRSYPHNNVFVFDFYNVLTSNVLAMSCKMTPINAGNHHRWWKGAVQHVQSVKNDFSAYGNDGDSHPTEAGNHKATARVRPPPQYRFPLLAGGW